MPEDVLELQHVSVSSGTRTLVREVSLRLTSGGWYGLVGANGSGKTTVMRAALGLLRPTGGSVRLLGAAPPARSGDVGVSFGPRLLHPSRRVRAELAQRVAVAGGGRAEMEAAWAETGLSDERVRCGSLSLGQAQRVSVTCALVGSPRLVVLDEPTVGLDLAGVDWLRHRLAAYVGSGGCAWVSSHDLSEIERAAHAVTVLHAGSPLFDGPTSALVGVGTVVRVASSRPSALIEALVAAEIPYTVVDGAGVVLRGVPADVVGEVLADRRVPVSAMTQERSTLEAALRGLAAHVGPVDEPVGSAR